jgi:hypothetical protein
MDEQETNLKIKLQDKRQRERELLADSETPP